MLGLIHIYSLVVPYIMPKVSTLLLFIFHI